MSDQTKPITEIRAKRKPLNVPARNNQTIAGARK